MNTGQLKIDVYWDLRYTTPERHTGVGKHVIEVVSRLALREDADVRVLLARDQTDLWESQAHAYGWAGLTTRVVPLTNKWARALFGITRLYNYDRYCAGRDLVYSPMEMVLGFKKIPFINTIHGIPCFEKTVPRDVYQSYIYKKERFKQSWFFRRCRLICAHSFVVSDYLKQRLASDFKFSNSKVTPVYNGADELFFDSPNESAINSGKSEIRLLTVGGANLFDGAPDLIRLAEAMEKELPEATLYVVGDRHEQPWEHQLRARSNVRWLGFLSSERLAEEMRNSEALVYLPAVESFGIIGVEAMAIGLPILAKRSTALPEVLGQAVEWINPEDSKEMLLAVKKIVEDVETRCRLIEAGKDRAQRYRWKYVSDRVYAALLAGRDGSES